MASRSWGSDRSRSCAPVGCSSTVSRSRAPWWAQKRRRRGGLQQLADQLQDAYADATTDPARTEDSETMPGESEGAGRRPAPVGGGGETPTPLSCGLGARA